MLTPTELHLLAGLLLASTHDDRIEVEFGSMIYDVAAEEERDVDVTIRFRSPNQAFHQLRACMRRARPV
jgi:hypothetical protein